VKHIQCTIEILSGTSPFSLRRRETFRIGSRQCRDNGCNFGNSLSSTSKLSSNVFFPNASIRDIILNSEIEAADFVASNAPSSSPIRPHADRPTQRPFGCGYAALSFSRPEWIASSRERVLRPDCGDAIPRPIGPAAGIRPSARESAGSFSCSTCRTQVPSSDPARGH
jgi:hypothetical protein